MCLPITPTSTTSQLSELSLASPFVEKRKGSLDFIDSIRWIMVSLGLSGEAKAIISPSDKVTGSTGVVIDTEPGLIVGFIEPVKTT